MSSSSALLTGASSSAPLSAMFSSVLTSYPESSPAVPREIQELVFCQMKSSKYLWQLVLFSMHVYKGKDDKSDAGCKGIRQIGACMFS